MIECRIEYKPAILDNPENPKREGLIENRIRILKQFKILPFLVENAGIAKHFFDFTCFA